MDQHLQSGRMRNEVNRRLLDRTVRRKCLLEKRYDSALQLGVENVVQEFDRGRAQRRFNLAVVVIE